MSKPLPADTKYIVRVFNTDLDGKKKLYLGLQKIKGVSFSFANAICHIAQIDKNQIVGRLNEQQVAKLNAVLSNPSQVPTWMFNRRKDVETGNDVHMFTGDLVYVNEMDVKRMKQIKSYRGLRHSWGLTVRGQRTKSNHRRTKAKKAMASKRTKKAAPAGAQSAKPSAK